MTFESFWKMLTTTVGTAAVMAAVIMVFYSSKKRSELHKKNKTLHAVIVAVLFGVLSIYASASAIDVDGALCNCRNLAPLYAGLVSGPIGGIGAALIGGVFRYFVYGGDTAMPCMLACFLAGVIGSVIHIAVKKNYRYNLLVGIFASVLTEGCHMLILYLFGFGDIAAKIALPIIIANVAGMAFCLYIYKRFNKAEEQ